MDVFTADFRFALIEKFSFGCPFMQIIYEEFKKLKLKGSFSFKVLNMKHILIKLECGDDFLQVWYHITIWIDNYRMRMIKWPLDFNSKIESLVVLVWIRVPELLVTLFIKEVLIEIFQRAGK